MSHWRLPRQLLGQPPPLAAGSLVFSPLRKAKGGKLGAEGLGGSAPGREHSWGAWRRGGLLSETPSCSNARSTDISTQARLVCPAARHRHTHVHTHTNTCANAMGHNSLAAPSCARVPGLPWTPLTWSPQGLPGRAWKHRADSGRPWRGHG